MPEPTRGVTRVGAAAVVGLLAALLPAAAHATSPGANGRIAFVANGDVWTINPNGSDLAQVTSGPSVDGSPAWSPDGTTIAFSRHAAPTDADPAPQSDIWLVRPGSPATRFTSTTTSEFAPAWAPDGRLSFVRTSGCSAAGVVVRLDGAGAGSLPPGRHTWSPAGDEAAVAPGICIPGPLQLASPTGGSAVFPGNDLQSPEDGFDRNPSWSPNGAAVVYSTVRWETGQTWLAMIRRNGSAAVPLTQPTVLDDDAPDDPTWSPDGRHIAYTFFGDIWLMNVDGSGTQPLTAVRSRTGSPCRSRRRRRRRRRPPHRHRRSCRRPARTGQYLIRRASSPEPGSPPSRDR